MQEHAQIEKMVSEGVISADQARLLKAALHESQQRRSNAAVAPEPDDRQAMPARMRSRAWKALIAAGVALALSIGYKPLFFLLLIMLVIGGCMAALVLVGYNFLVWKKEAVRQSGAMVQNEIGRKSALVPRIREVVYDAAAIETDTIKETTQTRAARPAPGADAITASLAGAAQAKEFQAVVESYPQLTSNERFAALLNELVATEDRITAMVKWHNYQAGVFNGLIETFPMSAVASLFGLQRADYLEA